MSGHGFLLANYVPGNSLLHRAPLWLKFLLVVGCGMASFLIVDWAVAAGVLVLMCALFLLSGAGFSRLFRAVRPVLPARATAVVMVRSLSGGSRGGRARWSPSPPSESPG